MHFANGLRAVFHGKLLQDVEGEHDVKHFRAIGNLCDRRLADFAKAALQDAGYGVLGNIEGKNPMSALLVMLDVVSGAAPGIEKIQWLSIKVRTNDGVGDVPHCDKPPET